MLLYPPNPPWYKIEENAQSGGYLTIVYNDELSLLPVRAVTIINDNKADPNLETKTYGFFSTCGKNMRRSFINQCCRHLFFCTNRYGIRVLTGYYHIGWAVKILASKDDYGLAAEECWFLEKPIPLSVIEKKCRIHCSQNWRNFLYISTDNCKKLITLIKKEPNAVDKYLYEIDRLERFNLKNGGYRNMAGFIKEPFSWQCKKVAQIIGKWRKK